MTAGRRFGPKCLAARPVAAWFNTPWHIGYIFGGAAKS